MKSYDLLRFAGISVMVLLTSACGGGGSGSGNAAPLTPQAVLKLTSSGIPSAQMAGIGVTVDLPSGVTPAMNSDGSVANTVVQVSGVAAPGVALTPVYTASTSSSGGTLSLVMVSSLTAGFGAGEFATVVLNLSSGALPSQSDFSLSGFSPISLAGNPVSGLSAGVTLSKQ